MFFAFESKFLAQIEHDARTRDSGRSRSSSEAPSQTSHDEWNEDNSVLSGDSREVDEGEDNNDEEDPGSQKASESSSSNEQGAPNPQQRASGGDGGDPPSDEDAAPKKKKKKKNKKKKKKKRLSLCKEG